MNALILMIQAKLVQSGLCPSLPINVHHLPRLEAEDGHEPQPGLRDENGRCETDGPEPAAPLGTGLPQLGAHKRVSERRR
jgi:hypothetical protein